MTSLFNVDRTVINRHIRNIYKSGELVDSEPVQKMHRFGIRMCIWKAWKKPKTKLPYSANRMLIGLTVMRRFLYRSPTARL